MQETADGWAYVPHGFVFIINEENQDWLIKFIIPSKLRIKFLKELDLMGINDYSLFASEDSLMHTLSIREGLKITY